MSRKAERLARKRAKAAEKRDSWSALQISRGVHGNYFTTPHMAENLTVVLACVNAIASSIAGLPFRIYRKTENGKTEQMKHPLTRLSRQSPNGTQTWPDMIEWLLSQTLLHGNGLLEIVTDMSGSVTALKPVPWGNVNVQMLNNGRLVYDISEITSIHGGTGRTRRLLQDEVLHLRDRTDDGLIGRSRLSRSRLAVCSALKTQEYSASMWDNQSNPSGVVMAKKPLSEAGFEELKKKFNEFYTGTGNARSVVFLDNEMSFQPVSISPEDAELLASRRFSVEDLSRVYGVPPTIVGDLTNSSFTNAETLLRYFSQFTLTHWVTKLEAEISKAIFTDYERNKLEVNFDLSGFLRGEPATRWNNHKIAIDANILTVNEVREIEGFNPLQK